MKTKTGWIGSMRVCAYFFYAPRINEVGVKQLSIWLLEDAINLSSFAYTSCISETG
jgi:hypothetical protein